MPKNLTILKAQASAGLQSATQTLIKIITSYYFYNAEKKIDFTLSAPKSILYVPMRDCPHLFSSPSFFSIRLMMPLVVLFALIALCVSALHVLPFHPIVSYTIAFMGSSALFLLAAYRLCKTELKDTIVYAMIGLALCVRLLFIAAQPVGSDDLYRYVWDGNVQSHGINPYAYAPAAPELAHLATEKIPSLVNHPEMKTIYFPLSEWVFYLSYRLSGEEAWGIKLLLFLSEVCALGGLWLLLQRLDVPRRFMLIYAFCPMLIFEYAIDAHVDGFGLPLLVFALYAYFGKRKLLSMVLLGLSLSIKPTALVLLPVFFFAEKQWKQRFTISLVPLLVLGIQFAPYMFSAQPFESLSTFTKNWTFNGFVFNALNWYVADNQRTRLICSVILAILVVILSVSKRELFDKLYYALLLLLLLSPVVHPWYVGWLVALLPAARKWSGLVFVSTLSLTCFTYISYQLHGVWSEEPVVWLSEYIPVIALMGMELASTRVAFFRRFECASSGRD